MSNDKVSKKNIWKNFTSFGVLISIIFCVFFFNVKIGFTVFENIEVMHLIIFVNLVFVIIFAIIITILFFYYFVRLCNKSQVK